MSTTTPERVERTERDPAQPLGLDIGTSRLVTARSNARNFRFESQLNAFITLPYSKLTEQLLLQQDVFHTVQGAEIVVMGNDAEKFAEVFHTEPRRPMLCGMLNPREPHSLEVERRLIARLVGKASGEKQRILFSVPAPQGDEDGGLAYHEASFHQVLGELGYDPKPINEGLAVVFGELGNSNYTGIGVSCGSGLCNVCLAMLSLPVISFSVPKAGDFIDTHAAAATGEVANRIRMHKEQGFQLNGLSGERSINALTVYYDEMIRNLTETIRTRLSSSHSLPRIDRPVPLVLSGGTAMPKGFLERFEKVLRSADFPVQISEIRLASEPLLSTAKGALMAALCAG